MLIMLPEMPAATDPTANWDDFERVVSDVAKATPQVLSDALRTTVSVSEQYILHPAPTRMVKKAWSDVMGVAQPLTKPVVDAGGVLVKAASDGAVAAQEFRRVCTTANLATCVPDCNGGFLRVIELLVVFLLCGHIVDAHTDATLDVSAQR